MHAAAAGYQETVSLCLLLVCQLQLCWHLGFLSNVPNWVNDLGWQLLDNASVFMAGSATCDLQVYCYEDSKLLKLFSQILRILYDADVLGEDAILFWYKRGSHPKGRNVFLHDVEPFIKWLEEAEEEGEED